MKFDLDKMNNANPSAVAQAAVQVIDRVQDGSPEVQVLGLGAAYLAFCKRVGVDPAEAFRAATNMVASKHRDNHGFRTLGFYVEHEL